MKFDYVKNACRMLDVHGELEPFRCLVLSPQGLLLVYAMMLHGPYSIGISLFWTDRELLVRESEFERFNEEFLEPLGINLASETIYMQGLRAGGGP